MNTLVDRQAPPWLNSGWILWGLVAVVMGVVVGLHPLTHTVTPEYREATENWFHGLDLYHLNSIHGFLYFPSSALIYWPVTLFPLALGEALWRIGTLALFAGGLWSLTGRLLGPDRLCWFGLVSALTLIACFSSARNGQTNLPLAGLMMLASVNLMNQRWNQAAAWLGLTLLLKPVALVMILLTFALFPPMRWRLLVAAAAVALLPWLTAPPAYVWRQHQLFIEKMRLAGNPQVNDYSDLRGLLLCAGINLPGLVLMVLRAVLGMYVLALCWRARSASQTTDWSVYLLGSLSAIYLMLGNPRTETNSYVILAPFLALYTVMLRRRGRLWAFCLFVLLCLTLGTDSFGNWVFRPTNIWLKPLTALIFLGSLAWGEARGVSPAKNAGN